MSDFSLETTKIQLRPRDNQEFVVFTILPDGITEEVNKSLIFRLVPTPAALQTMPIGEGVFFKEEIPLTIMADADRKYIKFNFKCINNIIIWYQKVQFNSSSVDAQ